MATLLIIGGTGFFGKSILDSFKRDKLRPWKISKVIVMSRNVLQFKKCYPELISKGVEFFVGDISKVNELPKADIVIHAAASTDASKYLINSDAEKNNIIAGSVNYCRLALKFHKNSKIVFCSSGAVYGHQSPSIKFLKEDGVFGDVSKLDEAKKTYAYAKRDSEIVMKQLGEKNLNVTIARCFTFIGKYLPLDKHFAIGNFIANGVNGEDIDVKTDSLVFRSYMYADDLVFWLMTLAINANKDCPIYNVASDQEIEIRELANIVAKILKVNVKSLKNKNHLKIDRYIPSVEKAKKELGLTNRYSITDSIILSVYS
jgi:nucleoside-diphosphate-sugar epimerase